MAHRLDLNNHLKYWLSEMSNLAIWKVSVLKIPVSVTEGRIDSICPLAGFDLEAKKWYSRNWAVRFLFWKARWVRSTGRGTGKCDRGSPFSQRSLIPIEAQLKTKRFKWESKKIMHSMSLLKTALLLIFSTVKRRRWNQNMLNLMKVSRKRVFNDVPSVIITI